ncbi:hypothetical protein [Streptomyces nanshensis]|uniref:hypothetical protein n=1 Tax=Streptomyces nanshensis TaxID=518642 RepID=UPI00085BD044|nr:hypothetical protein [Streptomyces nanshensis]
MTGSEEPCRVRTGPPPCPECGAATGPFTVAGEEIWRCTADDSRRRTYGLPDGEDDENLPPYEEHGIAYHGTGDIDCEATDALRHIYEDDEGNADLD